ncbi:MAG: hypothetical protein KAW12_19250, partial [Candidatus Aminicenantes bacterium]|nr:hypothetical protein [Candidatus Aminicenantes bacterium]
MKKTLKNREGVFPSKIKKNVNGISVAIIILSVILSFFIFKFDIDDYKKQLHQKNEFLKAEQDNFDRHGNYAQYGVYGFRLFFQQSKFSIFFNDSAPFGNMEASIHHDSRMKIGKQQKDGNIFKNSKGGSIDFPWLVLVIFAPVGLIYGFFAFRNREYIKFLMSFESWFKVHSSVVFFRLIILIGTIILIFTTAIIQFAFNGIHLSKGE